MKSSYWGDAADKREGMGDRLRMLDQSLTWVLPSHRPATRIQERCLPTLDREMVNLHARFERACAEE